MVDVLRQLEYNLQLQLIFEKGRFMGSKTKATELKRKKKKSKEGRERKRRIRSKGSTPTKKVLFGD